MNASPADVEAFTDRVYLDSEARAPNHTHHLYHQLQQSSVFFLFKIKKQNKKNREYRI